MLACVVGCLFGFGGEVAVWMLPNLLLLIVLVCYILVFVIGCTIVLEFFDGCACGAFVVCWLLWVWVWYLDCLWAVVCLLVCLLRLRLVWLFLFGCLLLGG